MRKNILLLFLAIAGSAHCQQALSPIDLDRMVTSIDAASGRRELSLELLATRISRENRVRMEKAMDDLSVSISHDRNNATLFLERGLLKKQLSMWLDATADIERAVRNDPKKYEAHFYLSELWMMQGSRYNALSEIEQYIKQCPDSAKAFYQKGLVMTFLSRSKVRNFKEQCQESIPEFEKAIVLNPNYREALLVRGYCSQFLSLFELALADYDKVLVAHPDDRLVYFLAGSLYDEQKDVANACTSYTKAKDLGAEVPDRILKRTCPGK
jgi:tetratricopeptide (TPR) repeat protein